MKAMAFRKRHPVASANRFDLPLYTGTIGLPLPSTDFAIRDDDGKDLPRGEVGEICIRGPQVMAVTGTVRTKRQR